MRDGARSHANPALSWTESMQPIPWLCRLSAVELSGLFGTRELCSEEVTRAVLSHIEAAGAHINAFAWVDAEGAMAQARAADRALQNGGAHPLCGVPFTVKDVIATRGMRTAYGSKLFEDHVPDADAEVVARLRRAGAVLVGKTTTPEFAHKILTDSPLHGITRNPWSLEHSAGGSSGGAGAAAAAGFAPLHVTTDGGGSSRVPAACCGVVGLKPTQGNVPNEQAQDFWGLQVLAGMSRTIEDLQLLYGQIAGPHLADPVSSGGRAFTPYQANDDPLACLRHLRVRWFPTMGNTVLDKAVHALSQRLLTQLEGAGAHVFEAGDIDWSHDAWRILVRAQHAQRFGARLSQIRDRLDPSMARCVDEGLAQTTVELQWAVMEKTALFRRLAGVFDDCDVFISPVTASPSLAADHRASQAVVIDGLEAGSLKDAWYNYTIPINGSGHPALAVPCGFTPTGLPVGVQIVGPWHAEPLLLAIGAAIQMLSPWQHLWPDTRVGL